MQRKMSAHIAADGSAAEHYDTLTHYFLPCSLVTSVVCLRRPHLADIREDGWHNLSSVIAGLDPAIHLLRKKLLAKKMDPRDESAFTRVFDALCPRVTPVGGRELRQNDRNAP
jgi:hypothetical protein